MNQAMVLAGTLLLCVFPFLIVLSALTGRGAASSFSRCLGLNQQAAADLGHLFNSAGATSATVTVIKAIAGAVRRGRRRQPQDASDARLTE